MVQEAQSARPRCAKAPSRRTGHGGCPRLANVARARESGLQAGSAPPKSGLRGLPKLSKHDHLILKCPKTHEGAQLGLGRDMRHQARLAPAENRNQTNQMPHTNIKQSKIPRIPLSHPTRFQNQNNHLEIPGKSREKERTLALGTVISFDCV